MKDIIRKALEGYILAPEEIAALLRADLLSPESEMIQAASRRICEHCSKGLAEVHAQVTLDSRPCTRNCRFCSFAAVNRVSEEKSELSPEEVLRFVRDFEKDGANAIYLMSTADYPFEKFIEISREVRRALKPDTVLVANIGDCEYEQAQRLKDAGFSGVYHSLRLGEGHDTSIDPETRMWTIRNFQEAGLRIGTCLEPVGQEHTLDELVEKILICREVRPVYSGAARRIPVPGTELAEYGVVSEIRMAHILAVVRLAMGYEVPGNCIHEPNLLGAAAGANLLWAEAGSISRDNDGQKEVQSGRTVKDCLEMLKEAGWKILDGPSLFYQSGEKERDVPCF